MIPKVLAILLCATLLSASFAVAEDVFVNGTVLDAQTKQALERAYAVPIKPGRYWYDKKSGVWGLEGGPAAGQYTPIWLSAAHLSAMRRMATPGSSSMHRNDVAALQHCLQVVPGQYWVLANGMGGLEGAPPSFNLAALCGATGGGGSSTKCENYGNGQFNCSNQRTGIGMIGEGGGQGAVFIDGKVIMTPN